MIVLFIVLFHLKQTELRSVYLQVGTKHPEPQQAEVRPGRRLTQATAPPARRPAASHDRAAPAGAALPQLRP